MRAGSSHVSAGGFILAMLALLCGVPARAAEPTPAAGSARVQRSYDIRDLIISVPDFTDAPDFSLDAKPTPHETVTPTREQAVERFVTLIKSAVAPGAWKVGSEMHERDGLLVVTADDATHREVAEFIGDLQKRRTVQVNVEVRTVRTGGLFPLLEPALRRKLRAALYPLNNQPATELTDAEVDQIVAAARKVGGALMVQPPRMTLFNGQRAYVMTATERAYVAGYTPKPGGDGFDPQVKVAEAGVVNDLQAGVSEDHKHVALNVNLRIAELKGMRQIPFAGAPASRKLMVDQPDLRIRELRTTVSVADGRTVILNRLRDVTDPNAARPAPAIVDPDDDVIVLAKLQVIAP